MKIIPLLLALFLARPGVAGDHLTPEEFLRLHAELQPGDDVWRTIPWNTSLLDARRVAAKQQKPLFIWAMDGHPLGCT